MREAQRTARGVVVAGSHRKPNRLVYTGTEKHTNTVHQFPGTTGSIFTHGATQQQPARNTTKHFTEFAVGITWGGFLVEPVEKVLVFEINDYVHI